MKIIFILAAAAFSLVELYLYAFHKNSSYFFFGRPYSLGIDRIEWNSFIDLRVVTDNGYGCESPINALHYQDCYFNATNIPLFTIKIARFLHISGHHSVWLGVLLGCVAVLMTTLFLASSLWRHPLISCIAVPLVLFSYPMRLALERGNIDLLVLILLVLSVQTLALVGSASLQSRKATLLFLLSLFLTLLASLSKVYPIVLFVVFALYSPSFSLQSFYGSSLSFLQKKRLRIASLVLGCCLFLWQVGPSLVEIAAQTPKDMTGGWAYGFMTVPEAQYSSMLQISVKLLFIGMSALLFFPGLFRAHCSMQELVGALERDLISNAYSSRLCAISFVSGSLLLAFSYFPFVNTYYRIIIPLTLVLPFLLKRMAVTRNNEIRIPFALRRLILAGIFVLLYSGYRVMVQDLQHYSNIFFQLALQPFLIGFFLFLAISAIVKKPISLTTNF